MVWLDLWSDQGEEGSGHRHRNDDYERVFHLDPLSLAQVRWTTLHHRFGVIGSLLYRYSNARLAGEDHHETEEQEIEI